MSRIGRKPVAVPKGVTLQVEGNTVAVKGPRGELRRSLHPDSWGIPAKLGKRRVRLPRSALVRRRLVRSPVSRLGFHRTNTQTKVLLPARRRPRSKPVSVPRLPEPHRSDWFSLTVSS